MDFYRLYNLGKRVTGKRGVKPVTRLEGERSFMKKEENILLHIYLVYQ